jgi:hypothetical protein
LYVEDGDGLQRLWDKFPPGFENTTGMSEDIEFLYRVTYAAHQVTVVARYGGYAGRSAEYHYRREYDTPDNTVELYRAVFDAGPPEDVEEFLCDIREPESYIQTLIAEYQPKVRAWRGRPPA